MDLSIIIVTWNTKELTLKCIQSIYEHTPKDKFNFEIILIDNASSDGTIEEVAERFPMVCTIRNSNNLGFAKANNLGIARASAPFILLLNSDTLVTDDAIYRTYMFLTIQNSDIAAATCKLLNYDGSLQIHCRQFYTMRNFIKRALGKLFFFLSNSLRSRMNIDLWTHDSIRSIEWAHMSFLLIHKAVFERIGVLDEQFFFYGEDMEFCYRLHKNGYKILFLNTSQILHKGKASAEKRYDRIQTEVLNALFIFYKKYNMKIEIIIIKIWLLFKKIISCHGK